MEKRVIRVLIVEDDEFVAMMYQDQLQDSENFSFDIELHGLLNDGLGALEEKTFDVLLLDLNLPDSDYQQTIEKIPAISNSIPVIVMTGTNDEALALKTMNLGAQDYLNKDRLDQSTMLRSMLYGIERHRLKTELKNAKAKSDELLANILPVDVIAEVKEKGYSDAKSYNEVCILFSDFEGFTTISEKLDAAVLVKEIDTCFRAFDNITEKYNIEKIKTIGDAYMAAGGIPIPSQDAIKNTLLAAIEMQKFIIDRARQKELQGEPHFHMRIGIHTGPVVAGIVGVKKFQYDIWGDAVNTASRFESQGESGRINISRDTYERVKHEPEFNFISRGMLPVKGKGEMEMWFAESK